MNAKALISEIRFLGTLPPHSWPNWAHAGAAGLASIALVMAGAWFVLIPEYDNLVLERQNEQALRADFDKKQRKVAALEAYKEQLAIMERDFGAMLRQLPGKTDIESLLNDISQSRVAAGLNEELFQPQPEIPKEFYAEVPNKITVTGTYLEMGTFVGAVAALPRIVTIEEVEIKPADKAAGTNDTFPAGTLRMSALAKTYRYLDAAELSAAAAAAKPSAGARRPTRTVTPAKKEAP